MREIDGPDDPLLLKIHAKRLISRDIDQLLGICEFALQDGAIDPDEARAIAAWLENHPACLETWPASLLYERLRSMLADGAIDDQEQGELLGLILQLVGPRHATGGNAPSPLPINAPPPLILFPDRCFCFTGVFDYGPRKHCIEAVSARGALTIPSITKKLDYLVIGNIGSEVWKHSSFGDKIQKAIEYRERGGRLAIISETHWCSALETCDLPAPA